MRPPPTGFRSKSSRRGVGRWCVVPKRSTGNPVGERRWRSLSRDRARRQPASGANRRNVVRHRTSWGRPARASRQQVRRRTAWVSPARAVCSAASSRSATGSRGPAVRPLGRRISATSSAIAMTTSAVPDGTVVAADAVDLEALEEDVDDGEEARADDRAGDAAHAADDEHRDRQECEVEVEVEVAEGDEVVAVERACDAAHEAGERERDVALARDVHARPSARPGRSRARRAGAGRCATA